MCPSDVKKTLKYTLQMEWFGAHFWYLPHPWGRRLCPFPLLTRVFFPSIFSLHQSPIFLSKLPLFIHFDSIPFSPYHLRFSFSTPVLLSIFLSFPFFFLSFPSSSAFPYLSPLFLPFTSLSTSLFLSLPLFLFPSLFTILSPCEHVLFPVMNSLEAILIMVSAR